jgi:hypothetical protein
VVLDHNTVIFQKEKIHREIKILVDLFNQIRKELVIFVHFKGFNISQKPKSSPLSYFAQKTDSYKNLSLQVLTTLSFSA